MPLTDRQQKAYEYFKKREADLKKDLEARGLHQTDAWRYQYCHHPYLIQETDEAILERLGDILCNSIDLSSEGKIDLDPILEDKRLGQYMTEVTEETNWRQILFPVLVKKHTEQEHSYFKNGTPAGVLMFEDLKEVKGEGRLVIEVLQEEIYRRNA